MTDATLFVGGRVFTGRRYAEALLVEGGRVLAVAGERPLRVDDLRHRFEAWLPAYMAGR